MSPQQPNIDFIEERFTRLFIEVCQLLVKLPKKYRYHSFFHTLKVLSFCEELAYGEEVSPYKQHLIATAALLHDIGFIVEAKEHEIHGCHWADKHLPEYGYEQHEIDTIKEYILATKLPQNPKSTEAKILCDADLFYIGTKGYKRVSDLLRQEWEKEGRVYSDIAWLELQREFLQSHEYWTQTAKSRLDPQKITNLQELYGQCEESEYHPLNILVPIDFTQSTLNALDFAVGMTQHVPRSRVVAFHVVTAPWLIEEQYQHIKQLTDRINNPYHTKIDVQVQAGDFITEIGAFANEYPTDIVVMGTHSPKGLRRLLTSDSLLVIRNSEKPFMALPEEHEWNGKPIQVIAAPIQLEPLSDGLMDSLKKLALAFNAKVALLCKKSHNEEHNAVIETNIRRAIVVLRQSNIPVKKHLISGNLSFEKAFIKTATELAVDLIATDQKNTDALFDQFGWNYDQNMIENQGKIPILTISN